MQMGMFWGDFYVCIACGGECCVIIVFACGRECWVIIVFACGGNGV